MTSETIRVTRFGGTRGTVGSIALRDPTLKGNYGSLLGDPVTLESRPYSWGPGRVGRRGPTEVTDFGREGRGHVGDRSVETR